MIDGKTTDGPDADMPQTLILLREPTQMGVGAGIKFSTFCNYVAAIENSKIDPGCRTNITLPAALTSVK
ncbi:hypothetical protein [Agrobacterium vitis]|uniref:Uncharacterized protein n=1 Tax=Agrobacterium vitis TaxID=373 RepID=A0AAE2UTH6_AGRVI|nr:hypothetical protein [Agrobacterium vitis]MBF2714361.1 hypothetical protein [Agrobacterium vitis]